MTKYLEIQPLHTAYVRNLIHSGEFRLLVKILIKALKQTKIHKKLQIANFLLKTDNRFTIPSSCVLLLCNTPLKSVCTLHIKTNPP